MDDKLAKAKVNLLSFHTMTAWGVTMKRYVKASNTTRLRPRWEAEGVEAALSKTATCTGATVVRWSKFLYRKHLHLSCIVVEAYLTMIYKCEIQFWQQLLTVFFCGVAERLWVGALERLSKVSFWRFILLSHTNWSKLL